MAGNAPGKHGVGGRAHVSGVVGHTVLRPGKFFVPLRMRSAAVELPAVGKLVPGIEQEEVRCADRFVVQGHLLRLVIQIGKRESGLARKPGHLLGRIIRMRHDVVR